MKNPFHLAIPVNDLVKAIEFYENILGCQRGRVECLLMFGFSDTYKYDTLGNNKKMLFYLGNSIVVNVLDEIIDSLEV